MVKNFFTATTETSWDCLHEAAFTFFEHADLCALRAIAEIFGKSQLTYPVQYRRIREVRTMIAVADMLADEQKQQLQSELHSIAFATAVEDFCLDIARSAEEGIAEVRRKATDAHQKWMDASDKDTAFPQIIKEKEKASAQFIKAQEQAEQLKQCVLSIFDAATAGLPAFSHSRLQIKTLFDEKQYVL